MAKEHSKPIKTVCDIMGKDCQGNIDFYTKPGETNMKVGLRIHNIPVNVSTGMAEGKEPPIGEMLKSPEYRDMLDQITYNVIGNRLVIKTPVDVKIDEITSEDITYPIYKLPYARSYIYSIRLADDNIKGNINAIVSAFVVAMMTENPPEEDEE